MPPERRVDEDDDNWVLANHGRWTAPSRGQTRQSEIDDDKLLQHYDDLIKVYAKFGKRPPPDLVPSDYGYNTDPDLPDDWRDHW